MGDGDSGDSGDKVVETIGTGINWAWTLVTTGVAGLAIAGVLVASGNTDKISNQKDCVMQSKFWYGTPPSCHDMPGQITPVTR